VGFQVTQGAVVAFLGEEDSQERDRRFGAICQRFNSDPVSVAKYVRAFPAAGIDLRLTQVIAGALCQTVLVDEIIGMVKEFAEAVGRKVELVIVDHARLAMDGDPNDAAHVTQLTRVLTHVAQATQAAVVLLCHSPKNVLSKDSDQINAADVAGSSAFVDNARSAFMLYGMRPKDAKALGISESEAKKYVKFECVKANYAPTGSVWWFEREALEDWQTAVLQPANLVPPMFAPGQAKVKLRQAIFDFVLSNPGKSQRQLRLMAGKAKRFGASEKDLVEALNVLLDEGRLSLRKPTSEECRLHRITSGKAYLFS
jgi:RecA-family ATPase